MYSRAISPVSVFFRLGTPRAISIGMTKTEQCTQCGKSVAATPYRTLLSGRVIHVACILPLCAPLADGLEQARSLSGGGGSGDRDGGPNDRA